MTEETLPTPRSFARTDDWIKRTNRTWQFRPPVDLHGEVSPSVVEAASGHTFVVDLRAGPALRLVRGAHITMEVPATWDLHLGNCFRRGVHTVGSRDQVRIGYGAFVDVTCSNPAVRLDVAVSWGRIVDLVDVVVQEGEVGPGDVVRLILGPPDGSLVQVQKHAQVAVLAVGVDVDGNGRYRRAVQHPEVRVVGAHAERFRVYAPAVVVPGQAFAVRVLPVDIYSHNPATGYSGRVHVMPGEGLTIAGTLDVDTEQHPAGVSVSAVATRAGVHAVTVLDAARGIAGRSNPIAAGLLADGLRLYFGEMHSQMWHSMGTGTTDEFFTWGRDVAGLDFCAPANHYNWRFEVTDALWRELVDTCNAYNEPGRFVTMVSYEWAGSAGSGHKNVYYRGADGEFAYWYRDRTSPEGLWQSFAGRDVLTVPHHTKALGGVDWRYRNDRHQRLVEICSKWGISEEGGPHSVQAALAMGHRLGFVGGTDSHYGLANQGSYHVNDGNGLACVYAREHTRDAIWQALYDRHCYATTGDRIVLDWAMDGRPMGTDEAVDLASAGVRTFRMRVLGTHRLDAVEIVRNNRVVFAVEPGADTWTGEWSDEEALAPLAITPAFADDRPFVFYYLRVRQANRQRAWASPIWLTQRAVR